MIGKIKMKFKKYCIILSICAILLSICGCKAVTEDMPDNSKNLSDYRQQQYTNNEFDYEIIEDSVKLLKHKYSDNETITVPNTINDLPVTVIGENVFSHHLNATSIVLPGSLKKIEGKAYSERPFFRCLSLQSIVVPKSVEKISQNPFYWCSSLKEITVEEGNKNYISEDGVLFNKDKTELISYPEGKSDTEYTIPKTVKKLNVDSLGYSTKTIIFVIPSSVTEFPDENMFVFPDRVTLVVDENSEAEKYAKKHFLRYEYTDASSSPQPYDEQQYIDHNYKYEIIDDGVKILSHRYSGEETLTVPDTINNLPVTILGSDAFYQHSSMTSIILPNSLKVIEGAPFYRCYSLKNIIIPKNVELINSNPFWRSSSLERIIVDEENKNYISEDGVLFNKDKTELIAYPEGKSGTEYTIPKTVKKISIEAFGYSITTSRLVILSNVTDLPEGNMFVYPDRITLVVEKGSAAEEYAKKYEIMYEYID